MSPLLVTHWPRLSHKSVLLAFSWAGKTGRTSNRRIVGRTVA